MAWADAAGASRRQKRKGGTQRRLESFVASLPLIILLHCQRLPPAVAGREPHRPWPVFSLRYPEGEATIEHQVSQPSRRSAVFSSHSMPCGKDTGGVLLPTIHQVSLATAREVNALVLRAFVRPFHPLKRAGKALGPLIRYTHSFHPFSPPRGLSNISEDEKVCAEESPVGPPTPGQNRRDVGYDGVALCLGERAAAVAAGR
jgi:hypothetical protein